MNYTNAINFAREASSVPASTKSSEQVQSHSARELVNTDESSTMNSKEKDQVSLSYASRVSARTLMSADDQANGVSALQQLIVSGSYNVAAFDIADRLIRSMFSQDENGK